MTSGALGSRCAMPGRMRMSRSCPGTGTACFEDRCERRRRVDISGFHPALPGAGHAADDNGQRQARRRRLPDAIAARSRSRACLPPSCPRGCAVPRARRRPGRRAKAGNCWCPNRPRHRPPRSLQLRPSAIRASATWYHAGLPASYARFAIDLRNRNQHDPQSCGATLFPAAWRRQRTHVRKNATQQ